MTVNKLTNVVLNVAGAYSRLCDGVSRRCCLLPRVERDSVGGKRRKRSPFDATLGTDDASKHSRNEKSSWDFERQRKYFSIDAGKLDRFLNQNFTNGEKDLALWPEPKTVYKNAASILKWQV